MFYRLLAQYLLSQPNSIQFLVNLERGVGIFIERKGLEASGELAIKLRIHAAEEFGHANILSACLPNPHCIPPRHFKNNPTYGQLRDGRDIDGISRRYPCFRTFFGGKEARDFGWADTLAFISILERDSYNFYQALAHVAAEPLRSVALKIAQQERGHSQDSAQNLGLFVGRPRARFLLLQWELRKWLALLVFVVS